MWTQNFTNLTDTSLHRHPQTVPAKTVFHSQGQYAWRCPHALLLLYTIMIQHHPAVLLHLASITHSPPPTKTNSLGSSSGAFQMNVLCTGPVEWCLRVCTEKGITDFSIYLFFPNVFKVFWFMGSIREILPRWATMLWFIAKLAALIQWIWFFFPRSFLALAVLIAFVRKAVNCESLIPHFFCLPIRKEGAGPHVPERKLKVHHISSTLSDWEKLKSVLRDANDSFQVSKCTPNIFLNRLYLII